ncbi:DUF6438 domain-containing protein [Pokkaliibacter sp. CJK22405]|uniref:DUF6438 domain-containing protein n=1 Tax=Pokkaliibacter sp. CJK22405 TaxID=3384615 RepID=UPI003984D9F8
MRLGICAVLVLLLTACGYRPTPEETPPETLSYSSGACYGACPQFHAVIDEFGELVYSGGEDSATEGVNHRDLGKPAFDQVRAALVQAQFSSLPAAITPANPAACGHYRTDAPTVEISAFVDQQLTKVTYYTGCNGTPEVERVKTLAETLRQTLGLDELSRGSQ